MPKENMILMLNKARSSGYAVGAFNILDFNSMRAVIDAAEEMKSPVILQTSVKTVEYWGFKTIISWYDLLTECASIPACIHLDHCKDPDFIARCLDHGWNSVMIDASSLPFRENVEISRKVVELARTFGASVEAELGQIGGVEEDLIVDADMARLADPAMTALFLEKVGVDCFAPAVGTAHGMYKGEPVIAYDNLEIIGAASPIPLALHGGTGLSAGVFKKCIALGCAKINISTQLKIAFAESMNRYLRNNPEDNNPLRAIQAQYIEMKQTISQLLSLFGSEGKAS